MQQEVLMANLTITIDDELLKRARIRAIEQGTSVSSIEQDKYLAGALSEPLAG